MFRQNTSNEQFKKQDIKCSFIRKQLTKNGSVKVDKFNTPVNGQNAASDYQFFK